jgi:parvulin-like peptidyl-prolyl isomerase
MMQKLRKNIRWVLMIVLVGFLGLIFFQWGLDITGIRRRPETDIAEINGKKISYQEYRRFQMAKENENKDLTGDQIWSLLVEEIMWRELANKEKITVNDQEILAIIRNNPPPELYQSEFMQDENGEFDWNKYNELLSSPQSLQWMYQYEMQLREALPKEKLRSLISTLAWISPFDDSIMIHGQTTKYDLSFINVQINQMRDFVHITDDELRKYYEENKDEFATPEYVVLNYVFFDRKPSAYDTLDAKERLEDLIAMVEGGEDFLTLAKEVSDDTTIEFSFDNANVLKPYMKNVYENLRNGEVSGIVPAARGFEVMKRVRNGLLYVVKVNVEVSRTTIGEIVDNIASFKETAENIGFDSAAVDFNLPVRKTFPLDKEKLNFPVRNTSALAEFLSGLKKGTIGGPFSSLGGYYIFSLDSVIPATQPTFEEAQAQVRGMVERKAYDGALVSYLDGLYEKVMAGATMEMIVQTDTLVKFQDNIKDQTIFVLRNTYGDEFAGAVAALGQGQVSKPVVGRFGGYIIRVDEKADAPFDSTMVGVLQWKRQVRLQQITENIFTPEELVDDRDKFFE